MRKLIIIGAFLAGAVCATLLLVRRPSAVSASHAAASSNSIEPAAPTDSTAQARRAGPPPAPISPSNALDRQDPDRIEEMSPYVRAVRRTPADPNGIKDGREMALTAYHHFVDGARLSIEQKKQFDQIIEDIRRMEFADMKDSLKNKQPLTVEGRDTIDQEAYTRVKAILTPAQYQVFRHEIGSSFGFVIAFLEHVPH